MATFDVSTAPLRSTVLRLLSSRKEKQNEFFALFRWPRAQGRDLPAHPGYGTHPPVPFGAKPRKPGFREELLSESRYIEATKKP